MLSYPGMNELLENSGSVFTAITIASKRARQLNDGAEELLEDYHGIKDVSKALEEIAEGKLKPKE